MKKDCILFDLDGTIIDPKAGITKSVQYSLNSFGIKIENPDDLVTFIGPPLRDSYKKYYGFNDIEVEKAVTKYREYFSEQGIFENTLYSGMDILLNEQKECGKTLIVATSKPTVFAKKIIQYFNLDKYFEFISGSELDGTRSKKSEVIQYAIDKLVIPSLNNSIMIGDREHDIIGAKTLGMDSIGVLYGYGNLKELRDASATHIVENVEALSKLLENLI